MTTRSTPERLDDAITTLLDGHQPVVEPELRPALAAADALRAALRPMPPAARFEARLGERLLHEGRVHRAVDAVSSFTRRELAHPGRLIAAGAVSSAAVGVTVTAFAVWRSSRRHPAPHRLLHR